PRPPARACASRMSAVASSSPSGSSLSGSNCAAAPAGAARRVLLDERDADSLPLVAGFVDLKGDDRLCAAALRALACGETGAEDGETLALVGTDEAEVFAVVEPEHLALQGISFRWTERRAPLPTRADAPLRAQLDDVPR